jgi:CTP:molybdopterin cytidylyltransferase MocA
MRHRSPIAIVLAAGGSTRMGEPKALLRFGDGTLLAHHVRGFQDAGLAVRVAVGGHAEQVTREAVEAGASAVPNPAWADTGPTHSLWLCISGLPDHAHVLVTPVDVPPAPPAVLAALLGAPAQAVLSVGGHDGHPIRVRVGAVRSLGPGETLRDALAQADRIEADWPDGLLNLNTPEAFNAWRAAVDAQR